MMFVDPEHDPDWDQWWRRLYVYLLGYAAPALSWRLEPTQNVLVARPALADEEKLRILEFLRSAPQAAVDGHRTLRRAVELNPKRAAEIDLVFFADPSSQESP
jgi:hypothetical protein